MTRIKKLFDLSGKVAIVTGASKGIGEAMARGMAEFGAKVVISSRKQEAVDEVADSFKEDGLDAIGIACHVADEGQREHLIEKTLDQYGRIDILINNANITKAALLKLYAAKPAVACSPSIELTCITLPPPCAFI